MNRLLQIIKSCLLRTFNYEGREGRTSYFIFLLFQLVWFCSYLQWFTGPQHEIGLVALLLFILPVFSCGVRRINDSGYSRGVIVLLVMAPYLLFPFLLFPRSREKNLTGR
ncbi:DUF805 domain-containing protein [Pantoea agglomerans]|uniref:DUF805 domain-containing protein n=1 Tax=Enterobacter agglomerans TaxID=549 RepID=UPI00165417AF|nr:DUF805 domain-containing protein [Pantoea agglomerans]WNK44653.1 DUF805 domain-containing protein [Pantoea agglomerans]